MSTRKTPGQRLREDLDAALPTGVQWTKVELVTLGTIEVMRDRLAALRKRADAAIADPTASATNVGIFANAARQLEVSMHGLIKTLDPDMVTTAKSVQHQNAAYSRWNRGGTG